MKIYKSKVDWWLGLLLVYPIYLSIASLIKEQWIYGFAGLAFVIGVVLFVSKTTRYIINDTQLIVKSLWIVNNTIDISKIRKIEKTNSILSSPALSLDRIALYYNKFDEVYISPKEKQDFLNSLLEINPNIEVKI
jgi:hypothetical protein